jgi:hypothetical protein
MILEETLKNRCPRTNDSQDITVNNKVYNTRIFRGWGYMTWNGSTTTDDVTITLPTAFNDAKYDITAICLGFKNGSNPTSRDDVGGFHDVVIWAKIISSSQFSLELKKFDNVNVGNTFRTLYSWTAIGTCTS